MKKPKESSSKNTTPSNVIHFPNKHRDLASTQSLEELKEKVLLNKIDFVDYMSAELLEELFFRLGMMGFSFDEEHFDKDNTLLFESLKSLILKGLGISYPMQDVAEKIISTDDSKVD